MDGCPAACAAANAVLDIIEEHHLVDRARVLGKRLLENLAALTSLPIVSDVRGRGLMVGIALTEPDRPHIPLRREAVDRIHHALAINGLVMYPLSATLAVLPPLSLADDEADKMIDAIKQTVADECRRLTAV
jgi:adenosylmethionine-8-amino-7-oxononanoate aminotransferase